MKYCIVLASLAACALAQRLRIQEPAAGQSFAGGAPILIELEDDEAATPVTQGTVIIAITECFDVCSQPSQWPSSAVLYNGPLNVQGNSSAPQNGHYQYFTFTLPQYQPGGAILSVAHSFDAELADGSFDPLFEYTNIQINIQ
ncbi:hypothetical protein PHLGIDRAFT_124491 [Phlebiopsis gigantea 11061_1 CR5-6]|uniref:Uncharacterized protein n=1 Tax=Phlebiopsis gigantea (strain 11061_1 CR5-6) TaxID=745531 RepID=A0A0C3P1V6_PHLG1|nr:hypothetical protein PHLGIDRAFT_124491 [Phlebiopsis gigantea 11061_1 CR5-6]